MKCRWYRLQLQKNDPQQQCRDLLTLLHKSENPQAFVQLYHAIKNEPHLQWLIQRIDEYSDHSVISLLQQLYTSDKTGEYYYALFSLNLYQHKVFGCLWLTLVTV